MSSLPEAAGLSCQKPPQDCEDLLPFVGYSHTRPSLPCPIGGKLLLQSCNIFPTTCSKRIQSNSGARRLRCCQFQPSPFAPVSCRLSSRGAQSWEFMQMLLLTTYTSGARRESNLGRLSHSLAGEMMQVSIDKYMASQSFREQAKGS
jgi:hypothetical protein